MEHADEQGWRISEVERLTGLPRRDIQRCCYEGRGGVGILSPKNSTWGRRTYDQHDLAILFVVARYRAQGYTLPQIKAVFQQHPGDTGLTELLDEEIERVRDHLGQLLAQYVGARALRASLEKNAQDLLANLFQQVATVEAAVRQSKPSLDDVLALPGMELLVELWLGPGSSERL